MTKFLCAATFLLVATTAQASITADAISNADYNGGALPDGQSGLAVKVQVLLDRADISPGVIDGYRGGMTTSAISAFETREGLEVDGVLDQTVWDKLGGDGASAIVKQHQITESDLSQFTGENPEDYAEMAKKDLLGYVTAAEALAEAFHMDVDFLTTLNPDSDFSAGSTITVVAPKDPAEAEVAQIIVNKSSQRLVAKTADGTIVANYPVSVGSSQTPSPAGTFEVNGIAIDPTYTYNPDKNFQQGENDQVLQIPPGPNGPVGSVWIDLSKPTYGIHGTPDPAALFTAQSHGCVRMTNWDARELAGMVSAGVSVVFEE
ncbi:L,D-transpeptidase family protein [Sulfitobacter aestuariivivens]|uniref:Murein L,D-transpeptidase n=1 Tax=Sulfitobacter aestuariivivens TaxID=2766981 RepID=A0A927D2A0_9RHOB|nr:L,D-transpeptidase family protein [Sulfitobacter aestuariivivens]MBD3663768.1 murein L,D-transpeptidase [Sulfitobacter aestuariivivens]